MTTRQRNAKSPVPRPAVTARLDGDLIREVVAIAAATQRTRSEVIERLLAEALAARRRAQKGQ